MIVLKDPKQRRLRRTDVWVNESHMGHQYRGAVDFLPSTKLRMREYWRSLVRSWQRLVFGTASHAIATGCIAYRLDWCSKFLPVACGDHLLQICFWKPAPACEYDFPTNLHKLLGAPRRQLTCGCQKHNKKWNDPIKIRCKLAHIHWDAVILKP